MGTRLIDPQPLIFDHAAQFFTVSDQRFSKLVDGWLEKGLVRQWQGTIGELEVGGQFVPLPSSPPRYIGVNGMRPLADSILSQVINPTCSIFFTYTYYSIYCYDDHFKKTMVQKLHLSMHIMFYCHIFPIVLFLLCSFKTNLFMKDRFHGLIAH